VLQQQQHGHLQSPAEDIRGEPCTDISIADAVDIIDRAIHTWSIYRLDI